MMNKSEVCVKLTRKNCKKVLGILEMFGENPSPGLKEIFENPKCIRSQEHIYYNQYTGTFYRTSEHPVGKDLTLIKPRELRNILAKEHLKEGDFFIGRNNESEFVGIHDKIEDDPERKPFAVSNWRQILGTFELKNSTNDPGWFEDFLRFATDEEKALLEPKLQISEVDTVETKCGIIEGFTRYTREVWVNHYSNGEFDVYENKDIASFTSGITGKTVKGTLTYDIPMTKV